MSDVLALPASVRVLLWDCEAAELSWERHGDFLAERVLSRGDWDAICWLRQRAGNQRLRELISHSRGRFLTRRQLRFWELVLDLPAAEVDTWLSTPGRVIWDRRAG